MLNGQAAKRDVISPNSLYSRSSLLRPYRFEPERVLNAEDSESENEAVNDGLEGHFGVLVRDVKPCQRKENLFVAENSQSQKTKWKLEF